MADKNSDTLRQQQENLVEDLLELETAETSAWPGLMHPDDVTISSDRDRG